MLLSSRILVCVTIAAVFSLLAGTANAADHADVDVRLPGSMGYAATVTTINQVGSAKITVDVARLGGGVVKAGPWRNGSRVMDFPAFTWSSTVPRAVVRVRPSTSEDPLAPRWRNFEFGAGFRKDARSAGTSVDNGDNLIQRGLWNDSAQYKLEMDNNRPACRIKGDRGAVTVRAPITVRSDRWYEARCSRIGSAVKITVTEFSSGSPVRTVSARRDGATGKLAWSKTQTPLSIGGKLAADGPIIRSATDQFNGLISEPFVKLHTP